jgi:hypothetical protein
LAVRDSTMCGSRKKVSEGRVECKREFGWAREGAQEYGRPALWRDHFPPSMPCLRMPCRGLPPKCLGDCTLHPASQSLCCAAVPLTAITDQSVLDHRSLHNNKAELTVFVNISCLHHVMRRDPGEQASDARRSNRPQQQQSEPLHVGLLYAINRVYR